jgi:hypothetical protein
VEGYAIGLTVGIGAGIVIGFAIGRKEKPWSELTPAERKNRLIAIVVGSVLSIAGIVVLVVRLMS